MRVGVIRGDMPGPVFLADLESVSQFNPTTEPMGQARYISRPSLTAVAAALSVIPAGLLGTVDMTGIALPIVINAGNRTIKVRLAPGPAPFVTLTVATASYASVAALMVAVNAALTAAGVAASVSLDRTGVYMVLKSTATGTGAYIEVDSVAGGSTFNAVPGIGVAGASFVMPSAAAVVTAMLPVGGPLDVSYATMLSTIGGAPTTAQIEALRDTIAPKFIDTDVAIKCFQVGDLHDLLSASFNPDPNRLPALTNGPAVTVVQDDGTTLFTAPMTVVTNAQLNTPTPGKITITGTNLGNAERHETTVKFIDMINLPSQHLPVKLAQAVIEAAGGSVSATSIVIPASLVPSWAVATTTKVQVQYTSFASNVFALV